MFHRYGWCGTGYIVHTRLMSREKITVHSSQIWDSTTSKTQVSRKHTYKLPHRPPPINAPERFQHYTGWIRKVYSLNNTSKYPILTYQKGKTRLIHKKTHRDTRYNLSIRFLQKFETLTLNCYTNNTMQLLKHQLLTSPYAKPMIFFHIKI